MYLNKTAELTEQIISVPRIIEMSCRITQRRETRMHSSEQQRCDWHRLRFHFQITGLQSCQGAMKAQQVCLRDDQRTFCCRFNECGHLELGDIAWKHPSRQEVEMWFGCKIIWKIAVRRVDAVLEFIFAVVVRPCRIPSLLPLLGHLPSCLWGHLLVQSSSGQNKLSCQSDLLSPLMSPGERLLLPSTRGRLLLSAAAAPGDSAMNSKRRKWKRFNSKGWNLADFRGWAPIRRKRNQVAGNQTFRALVNLFTF